MEATPMRSPISEAAIDSWADRASRTNAIIESKAGSRGEHWFYLLLPHLPDLFKRDKKMTVWNFAKHAFYVGESADIVRRSRGHFYAATSLLDELDSLFDQDLFLLNINTKRQKELALEKLRLMKHGGYMVVGLLMPSKRAALSLENLFHSVFNDAGLLNKEIGRVGPIVWPLNECDEILATCLRKMAIVAASVPPLQQCLRANVPKDGGSFCKTKLAEYARKCANATSN